MKHPFTGRWPSTGAGSGWLPYISATNAGLKMTKRLNQNLLPPFKNSSKLYHIKVVIVTISD